MTTDCTDLRARGAVFPRRALIEQRLRRFDRRYREQVRGLADRHERLAELALSFPALLFVLALRAPDIEADATVAGVLRGEKLANLARQEGIPLWLRKFLPEALSQPIETLPDSERFRREIGNYIPRSPKIGGIWLRAVGEAYALAHEAFALWIAREMARNAARARLDRLRLVALWAWFSVRLPADIAYTMPDRWHDGMGFSNAVTVAEAWRDALQLHLSLGEQQLDDMWLRPMSLDGYDFVALASRQDILGEALAMRNCLRSYGSRLARNMCRIWSIRRDGARVATLELACRPPDPCPRIVQIRVPNGDHAPPELWWLAHAWVGSHDLAAIDTAQLSWKAGGIDQRRWASLWRPYWLDKRRIPAWLPVSPSRGALHDI